MKKIIYGLVIGIVVAFTGAAVADYTIKDGGGSTQTVLAFVCATTKICPAHVLIKSDGTEIGTTSNPVYIDCNSGANTLCGAIGAAVPAGTNRIGYTTNDPCSNKVKLNKPFTTNGTSSVELVAVSGSTTVYVCSLSLIAAGATTVAFTTGTGTACATGNAAVIGSTTSGIANSMSFAANGGLTLGGGAGTIALGASSSAFCMVNGSNVYVSGNITYVQE